MQIPMRLLAVLGLTLGSLPAPAADVISLPPAQTGGGKPLMEALRDRRTTRDLATNALPLPVLANLLWAGFGINRPATDHRTAPSAMNSQEVEIYVARPEGLSRYAPKAHQLIPVPGGDLRARTTGQAFGTNAPVVLIYVADLARLTKAKAEDRPLYAGIDTGCISQNIYLFCASEGLATVVYDLNRPPLAAAMQLRPAQRIVLCQAVGYPKP
jgi:nitroreductase